MSGIRSTYLLQRSDDESLSLVLCVRDGDPDGRRHFSGSVALGGSAALVQYSPTRRDDFVRCDSSGARPKNFQTLSGYEQGLFGMEGRGLYAGGNVGGVYAQVAQNGGWSYGGSANVAGLDYNSNSSTLLSARLLNYDLTLIGQLSADKSTFSDAAGDALAKDVDDGGENTFVLAGHGVYDDDGNPVGKFELSSGIQVDAAKLLENLSNLGYKKGQDIRLVPCGNAVLAKNLSVLMPGISITGPTTKVRHTPFLGHRVWLQGDGTWNTYQNGNLMGTVKDDGWLW